MTWLRGLALAFVVVVAGGGVARADEPTGAPAPGVPGAREDALGHGLSALKVRMAAKLKEAELLEAAGRSAEALAATRDVERLYREGVAELQRLLGGSVSAAPAGPASPAGRTPDVSDSDDWDSGLDIPSFAGRGGMKNRTVSGGGRTKGEDAILHGLRWLAAHQSPDGAWEAAGFDKWCDGKPNAGEKPDGAGNAHYDVGVTGLALSAFLGAGYTHRGEHYFTPTVRKGLEYLKNVQDAEGCFGPRSSTQYVYNHARASLAMVEAYGMTGSPALHGSAQKALNFIALARNPYFAWRFGVKPGENDTSVTAWMSLPLFSARLINADAKKNGRPEPLAIDEQAFHGITAWLDKMTDPDTGRVGYQQRGSSPARTIETVNRFPAEKSESLTAMAVMLRVLIDPQAIRSEAVKKGVALISRLPPTWNTRDGSIDFEHWYFGTVAHILMGGEAWGQWEKALGQVVGNQRMEGLYCVLKGSWDPVDPWSPDLGRVYSTAIVTLCYEAIRNYERVPMAK